MRRGDLSLLCFLDGAVPRAVEPLLRDFVGGKRARRPQVRPLRSIHLGFSTQADSLPIPFSTPLLSPGPRPAPSTRFSSASFLASLRAHGCSLSLRSSAPSLSQPGTSPLDRFYLRFIDHSPHFQRWLRDRIEVTGDEVRRRYVRELESVDVEVWARERRLAEVEEMVGTLEREVMARLPFILSLWLPREKLTERLLHLLRRLSSDSSRLLLSWPTRPPRVLLLLLQPPAPRPGPPRPLRTARPLSTRDRRRNCALRRGDCGRSGTRSRPWRREDFAQARAAELADQRRTHR